MDDLKENGMGALSTRNIGKFRIDFQVTYNKYIYMSR